MGKHRQPGRARPALPSPPPTWRGARLRERLEASRESHREQALRAGSGRHSAYARSHWTERVAGVPWLTLVLLVVVSALGLILLRPDGYAATSTVVAATPRAAQETAVELTRLDLARRVETELELDRRWRGDVRYEIEHQPEQAALHVTARGTDPRLTALSADTAAALAVTGRPDDLSLATTAEVPSAPEHRPSRWWIAAALAALAGSAWWERKHHAAELRTHAGELRHTSSAVGSRA